MKASRLAVFRTASFRTAAISALCYAVLTAIMLAIVYPLVASQIQARIKAELRIESSALVTLYDARGEKELARVVRVRSSEILPPGDADADDPGRRYYALASANGRILAGDLRQWPAAATNKGWAHFHIHGHSVRAYVATLANGQRLLVAQSLTPPNVLGKQADITILICALAALLAGLAGGAIVGASVLRRIRRASAAAARIQAGHLEERIPLGGSSEEDMLARAFNAMLERIESAVLGLRDLASQTAHEVRHPLARMERALARAEAADSLDQARADLRKARHEISELARRTEALLRLARLENENERRAFFRELDLAALVRNMAELYLPAAAEQGHALGVETTHDLRCLGDHQLLAQALANLLDNALHHSVPGCEIAVRVRDNRDEAVIAVRNEASPLAEPAPEDWQWRGAKLGLAIVGAIAKLHRGRLEIDRRELHFEARLILPSAPSNDGGGASPSTKI